MANLTLLDWSKRVDPDGSPAILANLLSQTNEILIDMVMREGNLPTGERVSIATGLPTIYYRSLNQGIAPSKGTAVQVDEGTAIIEARSEMDRDLAMLNGNTDAFRMGENRLFLEGMNQTAATGMFYGNPATAPKQFLGLTQRFSSLSAGNAQNILSGAGATAAMQTSVWLICWGDNATYGIFPKGSQMGLEHRDLGEQTAYEFGGAGLRAQVLVDWYQWKLGLVVKDWRSVVRICNLDTTKFASLDISGPGPLAPTVYTNIIHLMARAVARIPKGMRSMTRPAFYMNASTFSMLMRIALEKSSSALSVQAGLGQFGQPQAMLSFLGIPIRQCDAILNTEIVVT